MCRFFKFRFVIVFLVLLFLPSAGFPRNIPGFTADVMAPLIIPGTVINDSGQSYEYTWDLFDQHLQAVKAIGVGAVSTDVWWGLVERQQDVYDWSYYDVLFEHITKAGLQIHPIMSFHACGGDVGDTYNSPLPNWIWTVAGPGGKYINELENPGNPEYVSIWAQNISNVHQEYAEYMQEFESHFNQYAGMIQEIDISCGPSGEWRYPSYDVYTVNGETYGRGYPTRGYLYCYSKQAKEAFINAMQSKYTDITTLNQAWGTNLSAFNQISPPTNGDAFFNIDDDDAYINGAYGRDFIQWYHTQLVKHGQNMLNLAVNAFDEAFASIPLGIKIPGVHWTAGGYDSANAYANTMPRSAEVCAGIVGPNFIPDIQANGCGQGYAQSVMMLGNLVQNTGVDIRVYFTCIDMPNNDTASAYSMASALAFGVGDQAEQYNLMIKGENALAPNNGSTWGPNSFWWNINNVLEYASYSGINILRIFNVVNPSQKANYQKLISAFSVGTKKPLPRHR
jgi:beta-amylase